MRNKLLFSLLLFITICYSSKGQSQINIDSLLKAYKSYKNDSIKVNTAHAIYDYFYGHNTELAMQYSNEGLELAKKLNFIKGIAKSYDHMGVQFKNTRQLDSAFIYYQKALDLYNQIGDKHNAGILIAKKIHTQYSKTDYAEALMAIDKNMSIYSEPEQDSTVIMMLTGIKGRIYMRQTRYDDGIKETIKAIKIAEKIGDHRQKAIMTGTLSSLYHYTENEQLAIELKKESLEYYRKVNDKRLIALALNDLGNTNYVINNYDIALNYLKESLPISKEMKLQNLIAITLYNIGKTHIALGAINEGIIYLKESLHYSQNVWPNPLSESWALQKLADVYTEKLNQPNRAIPLLNRAIVLADSVGNKDDLYGSFRDRSQAFEILGDYKKALEDHKNYKAINDSVYNIERSEQIQRLKAEFETEKKEKEITLQKNTIDLMEQKAKVGSLQKLLLGCGLLLSIGLIAFSFYSFRQKLKRNKAEKEKLDKELAFKKKELTTHALHLAKKNELLAGIKAKAEELKIAQNRNGYNHLIRTIDFDLQDDNNWENFSNYFQQVHKDFNSKIKLAYPAISASELRFLSLIKMNLSSKEIASILNISNEGIKKARYRVRKKIGLESNESLEDLILSI